MLVLNAAVEFFNKTVYTIFLEYINTVFLSKEKHTKCVSKSKVFGPRWEISDWDIAWFWMAWLAWIPDNSLAAVEWATNFVLVLL